MAKITKNILPAPLRAEDLNAEALVCRVQDTLVDVASDRNRRGKVTVILLWEFPGKGLYLNETMKEHAVAGFKSDETDDWKDKPIPLVVGLSEYEDQQTHRKTVTRKPWIAPPDQWAKLLKSAPKAVKQTD